MINNYTFSNSKDYFKSILYSKLQVIIYSNKSLNIFSFKWFKILSFDFYILKSLIYYFSNNYSALIIKTPIENTFDFSLFKA